MQRARLIDTRKVKQAAMAPAEPSGTDRAVAVQASHVETQARQEQRQLEKVEGDAEKADDQQGPPAFGATPAIPGRRPYSTEAVGQSLNVAV